MRIRLVVAAVVFVMPAVASTRAKASWEDGRSDPIQFPLK
jgi:hypothetical protein